MGRDSMSALPATAANERVLELERRLEQQLLEHRRQARGVMAVIRAMVRRTSQDTESVEDYVAHLEGRLGALSRIQEILLRDLQLDEHPRGADLAELVSSAFLA